MSAERRKPSRSPRGRQQVEHLLAGRVSRVRRTDRLDTDMVGAGIPMLLNAASDRAFVTPRYHGI